MRIVIALEHESIAQGLALLLKEEARLEIIAVGFDLESALECVGSEGPDLLLLDGALVTGQLREVVDLVAQASSTTGVALFSATDEPWDLRAAVGAGVRAYISASLSPDELRDSVLLAASGQVVAAGPSLSSLQDLAARPDSSAEAVSDREIEVVRLVAQGATNREIASALTVTENTVKVHLRNIFHKLGVRNRAQLTGWARDERLPVGADASVSTLVHERSTQW